MSGRFDQPTLFGGAQRLVYDEAVELTLQSMQAYGPTHDHWVFAFSGGKDSTATLTVIVHLVEAGRLPRPKSISVLSADTRMELTPLTIAGNLLMERLRSMGIYCEVVTAPLDKRFFVYMLGRGVPPPNNNTLRWCTRQIKVDPMTAALERRIGELDGSILMITGVRQGESAIRDGRIAMSCGKDGAECGQGWYQQVLPEAKGIRGKIATLAPLLHWRVCNVFDWLKIYAPMAEYGAWETSMVADAYGGEEAEEINARTGCVGCALASEDLGLKTVIRIPYWSYIEPLLGLKPLYRELRQPTNRLRKSGVERLKDGSIAANPQRMGPLTMEARLYALDRVLSIQAECNEAAIRLGRPLVDILNAEEEARIRELISLNTWPDKWDGEEPRADTPLDAVYADGSVQPLLM
ncbi:phosphoadenosine phosphosulfate reductase domain-containing protein [Rhizobium sp. SU303]|uniref:phosphoadenosine phosphosulfate reductase domain-containing protein n=1 Tax=Rhizobium sp. SU303 TaxID=3138065 RepID=UPI001E64DDF8|nr:phosphoadenosine phosphosulfate reductase family protein [Rhizobium leguminosarum]UFW80006.1 phosphoadenosine phosphosulfate reductase family protein [Rhizobium leguminosarum bv. viciae]